MARALSLDLRRRVVAAIAGGMSCRQAAVRFGVSASSAVRWQALARTGGTPAAKRQGGDQRSRRLEEHAPFILGMLEETPDITLAEMQTRLAGERGGRFSIGALWRFLARRRITRKKSRRTQPSRIGPTS
jgi:transposase